MSLKYSSVLTNSAELGGIDVLSGVANDVQFVILSLDINSSSSCSSSAMSPFREVPFEVSELRKKFDSNKVVVEQRTD